MGKKKEKRFRAVKNQPTGLLEIRDDNLAECLQGFFSITCAWVCSHMYALVGGCTFAYVFACMVTCTYEHMYGGNKY